MRVAVIPARGGSKRIPRKNIRDFAGKPMIAWSIDVARASGAFDAVIVSTDDADIASVARGLGADVPFIRPAELSDDKTGTTAVVSHAVTVLRERGESPSQVCCLYATAPFVTADDLRGALDLMVRSDARYVFSATSFAAPVQRALRLDGRGAVSMFYPEHEMTRSQDLEPAFHDAGQFYWGRADAWLGRQSIFCEASRAWLLPRHRVQDIDTEEDWTRAELMFEVLQRIHDDRRTP